jgi:hypothetical protein
VAFIKTIAAKAFWPQSTLVPKPGRSSYELAKSLRPISLTSFFLKIMVDLHVKEGQLKNYPLNPIQESKPERQID